MEISPTNKFGGRRRQGKKKIFAILLIILTCAVSFIVGFLIGYFAPPRNGLDRDSVRTSGDARIGTSADNDCTKTTTTSRFDITTFIVENVDKNRIRETLKKYSSDPRLAGTLLDKALADMIADDWRNNGLEEVHLATYNILLSFPNTSDPNLVQIKNQMSGEIHFQSHPYEVVLTPAENNSQVVPPFNSYSPARDVMGDVVYVNYGRIEDFEFLTVNLSVNVTGAIVIARYGKIFRGDKLLNAQRFHAVGLILYSDPSDYNLNDESSKDPYPGSWWLPPTGIQRGTVGSDGDPLTPIYPSTYYAHRLNVTDANLPRIPCQPIGYSDAREILRRLGGPEAPPEWQGKLNITYHVGPGFANTTDVKTRLKVNNYLEVRPVYNVIGYIRGSDEPDRYVLLGNHHDAWVFGAIDPLSGSASITEIARVFGELLKNGHRPRRTIVFCSWDAEEYGLMGSIEWVEDHLKLLHERGVAYINLDYSANGNFTLALGTSPLLQDLIYTTAAKIPSPELAVADTLFNLWKKRPVNGVVTPEPSLTYSLGSGSDMAAFYQRAGVPSIDLWMTFDEAQIPILAYPLYHSSYETFYAYDTFTDPGFNFTKAITQLTAAMVGELANADLLPMKVQRYSAAVSNFHTSLMDAFGQQWKEKNVSTVAFSSAVTNFTRATSTFQKLLDSDNSSYQSSLKTRILNDKMMMLERAFLDPEGLPGRPMQKHVMFAPSMFDAYVDNSFPGIVDSMYDINHGIDKWDQLRKQVFIATYIIQSAASTLEDIGL